MKYEKSEKQEKHQKMGSDNFVMSFFQQQTNLIFQMYNGSR